MNNKVLLTQVPSKHEVEIDFSEGIEGVRERIQELAADEKAGYPPKCNAGYEVKDGKCVKIEEDTAKKHAPDKKKDDKKKDDKKKGDEKEGGNNLPPWLKKKK